MSDPGSASGRLGASALPRQVGIGQQCCRRSDGAVVVYQVHRGDRTVEAQPRRR